MLKKLFSKKIVLVICGIILAAGIALCFSFGQKQKPAMEQESTGGLEVKEEVDEKTDHVDGSGSWEPTEDTATGDTATGDTVAGDTATGDTVTDKEEEGILEDDKEWSSIS